MADFSLFGGDTGGFDIDAGGLKLGGTDAGADGFSGRLNFDVGSEFMPAGGGPASGGGSWGEMASNLWSGAKSGAGDFGSFAKGLLPLLGIGTGVMGAVTGAKAASTLGAQSKLAEQASTRQGKISEQAMATAAPIQQFSAEELALAREGKVPPAIQSQIDAWKQGAKQLANDYAARSGQGQSQTLTSWLQWIEQQAESMKVAAIEQMQQMGVNAGGVAGQVLGGASQASGAAAQGANANMVSIEGLIASANQAMARLNASAA